jgi:hypothetical protein
MQLQEVFGNFPPRPYTGRTLSVRVRKCLLFLFIAYGTSIARAEKAVKSFLAESGGKSLYLCGKVCE